MKYLLAILLIYTGPLSFAQKFSTSIDLQLAVPQGDYKDVNPDAGYGLRANFLYKPGKAAPVKVGIEFGIQEKARATEYLSDYYNTFKVSATSNIFSLMLLTRFQPVKPRKLNPFLDLTAGWNVFFSTVNVENLTSYSYYDNSYSNSSRAHWALAYGAAAGVDIALDKRNDLGLELKVAYLIGAYSRYLINPYIDQNGNVLFEEYNSRTTMLIPQAGVRIAIH